MQTQANVWKKNAISQENFVKKRRQYKQAAQEDRRRLELVKPGKKRNTAEPVYKYRDRAGKVVMEVCRLQNKQFRQRRPDGKGGYVWNIEGVDLAPYNLPEIKNSYEVFIAEGEKDCDNLKKLGLVATCNPMGAGKWKDSYSRHFNMRDVVIFPDNDNPGRQHALQVARSLKRIATSIKIVDLPNLPKGGDVSDWLEKGNTKNDLLELVKQTELWKDVPKNTETAKGHDAKLAYGPVDVGERNLTLTQFTGKWIAKGMDKETVRLAALGWNEGLNDPLEKKKVEEVVKSVLQTDKRNHPDKYKQGEAPKLYAYSEPFRPVIPI